MLKPWLRLGNDTARIIVTAASGSFKGKGFGPFNFHGTIDGVAVSVRLYLFPVNYCEHRSSVGNPKMKCADGVRVRTEAPSVPGCQTHIPASEIARGLGTRQRD